MSNAAVLEPPSVRTPGTAPIRRLHVHGVHATPGQPPYALGLLLAYARENLAIEVADLAEPRTVAAHRGSTENEVFLFSNYMWTLEQNLELSRRLKARDPSCVTIHGGPSTPSYPAANREFLIANPHVDYCVRGEGERTFVELLRALSRSPERPRHVAGLSFMNGRQLVQTAPRARTRDPNIFPSPYLTGVFDACDTSGWDMAILETNRGCPYGCTFCDWGSATRQKIAQFGLARVQAEIEWMAARRIPAIFLADANFGILARDLEITRMICDARQRTGFPKRLVVNYAKNTKRHLVEIVALLVDAGLMAHGILSVQTRDRHTLELARRKNLAPAESVQVERVFAERGLPLSVQLMIGMPGSTRESFKADLRPQICKNVNVQIYPTLVLPNSPMAEPAYLAEHQIQCDDLGYIVSTASCPPDEMLRIDALARLFRCAHTFGMYRHLLAFLNWEHGIEPIDFLDELLTVARSPEHVLHEAAWVNTYETHEVREIRDTHMPFREHLRATASWDRLYAALERHVQDHYGIESCPGLHTVLALQTALMPAAGRRFPERLRLEHDFIAYAASRLDPKNERLPLTAYPPVWLDIDDPHGLSSDALDVQLGRPSVYWELKSPLGFLNN